MAGDVKRWTEKCFEFRGQMNNGFLSFLRLADDKTNGRRLCSNQ
jgi:hypothetical protein